MRNNWNMLMIVYHSMW